MEKIDYVAKLNEEWRMIDESMEEVLHYSDRITFVLISKMTVPQLKKYVSENNIVLPPKGTGTRGNFVRSDYIKAITQNIK